MSYEYQTPQKHFYTPSPNKSRITTVKNDPQVQENIKADQYLTLQRSIIENNRYKLKSLLAQKNRLLGIQPGTPQFSPISKYSLRQSGINKQTKFSLDTQKMESGAKTVYIDDVKVTKDKINDNENQDQNTMLRKISNRVKGIIKNQSERKNPVYFTRDLDMDINHHIRNLVQENTALRSQVQQYETTEIQKTKKIQQITKKLNDLNKILKQKQQKHHSFVQIKDTQIQNLQRYYRFQIKFIMQRLDDSLKLYRENTFSKMEQLSIKNIALNKKIVKLQNNIYSFKQKFKVEREIFHDVTHRKVKNVSEISHGIEGDKELEDQQKQKDEFYEQVQRQKSQLQEQIDYYESKYKELQRGFLQMKNKNLILIYELQSMKEGKNKPLETQRKTFQNISTNTQLESSQRIDQQCNTIKLDKVDVVNQKYVKHLQQEISQVRGELQMLNKYFSQQVEKNQYRQESLNQSLIESFRRKPNPKHLAMIQNLAKKQRKQKNIAYIRLASLQKQLQTEKKKNKIYEEELSQQIERQQVSDQFTLEERRNLNMPDGNAGLQWQKVVKHKLKTILQQIKHIQANQKSGR